MTNSLFVDFSEWDHVNSLWPGFIHRLGLERAQQAVRQALDLQLMNGNSDTLPVLFFETCGLALVNVDLISQQTGLSFHDNNLILIISKKERRLQLLKEFVK